MRISIYYSFILIILFTMFFLSSCSENNFEDSKKTTNLEINTNIRNIKSLMYDYSEIDHIDLNVTGSITYVNSMPLEYNSTTGLWGVKINMLPLTQTLLFKLTAYNISDESIFEGNVSKLLTISDTTLNISLVSTKNNILLTPPNLIKVDFEDNISATLQNVNFTIYSEYNTTLNLTIDAIDENSSVGIFTDSTKEVNISDGNNSIDFEYIVTEITGGDFTYKLTIADENSGVTTIRYFEIRHESRGVNSDISVSFAPVIHNILIENNLTNIIVDLNVSDDIDNSDALNYSWQYSGDYVSLESFDNNKVIFSYDENFTSLYIIANISDSGGSFVAQPIYITSEDIGLDTTTPTDDNNETNLTNTIDDNTSEYITYQHNILRNDVNLTDAHISWDSNLSYYAQEWADYLAINNSCEADTRKNLSQYSEASLIGELVYKTTSSATFDDVFDYWKTDQTNYDISTNSCSNVASSCLDFKQLIFENSWAIGCGVQNCDNNTSSIWVCNYEPEYEIEKDVFVSCKLEDEVVEPIIELNSSNLNTFLKNKNFTLQKIDSAYCNFGDISSLNFTSNGTNAYLSDYYLFDTSNFSSAFNNEITYLDSNNSIFEMNGSIGNYTIDFKGKIRSQVKKDGVSYYKLILKTAITSNSSGTDYRVDEYWINY